ncbi:hypothetical protein [Neorhizobium sp. NCHU2750]|uniref:hypothetical protein n=1 Tax=Neorhizobium sp. NCHU2750 TaxID=1825976 RepID=UPI000E76AED2|nr:hypothetical protein NCHU2750_11660 [Neorhizobium sp. NCHU2750]
MKVKHLAFVAALAFTTPALAAPAYEDASQPASDYTVANSLMNSWLTAWKTVFDTTYGDDWDFTTSASKGLVYGQIFQTVADTSTAYTQSFLWTSASKVADYNMPVTAVPGPEAGAGLGALAMLGVAYWAKRRRNDQQLAA